MIQSQAFAAPLQAIEKVLDLSPQHIRITRKLAQEEPYFCGHYPHYPIFPGVFILEAIDQAVRYYAAHQIDAQRGVHLIQIDSLRFLAELKPGDRFELTCHCHYHAGEEKLEVKATCTDGEETKVARAKLHYVLRRSP